MRITKRLASVFLLAFFLLMTGQNIFAQESEDSGPSLKETQDWLKDALSRNNKITYREREKLAQGDGMRMTYAWEWELKSVEFNGCTMNDVVAEMATETAALLLLMRDQQEAAGVPSP